MHFTQIALLLSGVVAIDASPLPNNAAARSFKNVSDTVSFYGAAAFEKRQALGVVKGREQVSDDVVSDNTDVVVATNVSLPIITVLFDREKLQIKSLT
jgi:hypothetical protein